MNQLFVKRVNKNSFIIATILLMISIGVSITLFFDEYQPEEYKYLYSLPLSFGILSLCFCNIFNEKRNIALYAIVFMEFFRLVIIPLFLYLGDYYSAMQRNPSGSVSFGILLMIYEAICVFITANLFYRKDIYSASNNNPKFKSNTLYIILVLMVLFLVVVAILYPNSITAFKTIFDIKNDDFTTWTGLSASSKYEVGTINRVLGTLFTMVFSWVRYLLPLIVIIGCKKSITNETAAIIISLIPVALQMMFITATIMDGILCGFILMIVLGKVYPHKQKVLVCLSLISFLLIVGFYFWTRFTVRYGTSDSIWRFISENANAYVGGIDNVAAIMNLPDDKKWSTFFYNIYGAIPFNSTLFGLQGDKLAAVYNAVNNRIDGQIPPTIGAGWYYYGVLLAPLESILFVRLASYFGGKASVEKNVWKYATYTLIAIMMVMGFTTYNAAIVLNYTTTLLIPLVLLSKYTNDLEFAFFEE